MITDIETFTTENQARNVGAGHIVIKLGGSILDEAQGTLDDIMSLWQAGLPITVVHGGGPAINSWLARMGVSSQFIDGRRVTDDATLEVVRAVMAGVINTEIVRLLGQRGARAVGMSGLDAGMIRVEPAPAELGLVGLHPIADVSALLAVLRLGSIPVVTPLGIDPDGACRNVNADDVASAIAIALHARDLIFASDTPGIFDATGNPIPTLRVCDARRLIAEGVITGGMAPKIEGCLAALGAVERVHIIPGDQPGALRQTLQTEHHPGTQITR